MYRRIKDSERCILFLDTELTIMVKSSHRGNLEAECEHERMYQFPFASNQTLNGNFTYAHMFF